MVAPLTITAQSRLRFIEAHSGLSAMVIEHANLARTSAHRRFDGLWLSSLGQSTIRARHDDETLSATTRLTDLDDIRRVSQLPVLYDADSGGSEQNLVSLIVQLNLRGCNGLVIEDKVGTKVNSLQTLGPQQEQADPIEFAGKIATAAPHARRLGMLLVARVESLIAGRGLDDALSRSMRYVDAGANAIMIHSRHATADEVVRFCERYRPSSLTTPIIVVPSTFDTTTAETLFDAGVNVVIYANQLIRAAHRAMQAVAASLLDNDRASDSTSIMTPIPEILRLLPDSPRGAPR
jgi:phosphoenolpyruvate phosphomutase